MRPTMRSWVWLVSLTAMLSLSRAVAYDGYTLADNVSIGGTYPLVAYVASPPNDTISCAVVWQDRYNNTVHVFTTDPEHNAIRLSAADGYVRSYNNIDGAFFAGEYYNMTLACGSYTVTKNVFIDVAGDLEINRFIANTGSYYYNHPVDSIVGAALAFLFVSAAIKLYTKAKNR